MYYYNARINFVTIGVERNEKPPKTNGIRAVWNGKRPKWNIKRRKMTPRNFAESTKVLRRPTTMSDAECGALPVWSDGNQCVSCWRASLAERLLILFTGRVWLGVYAGKTQPPVFVEGRNVFPKTPFLGVFRDFCDNVKEFIVRMWKGVKNGFNQPDKWKHFVAGFVVSALMGIFCGPVLGVLVASLVGSLKEYWDAQGHGTPEFADWAYTTIGALFGLIVSIPVHPLVLAIVAR